MSSDGNPTPEIVEGVTTAAAKLTGQEINKLISKFINHQLVFIEDEYTIEIVKSQKVTPEWKLLNKYVHNTDLRLLIQLGLTLRSLETNGKNTQNLRDKIVRKYGKDGLHVAELVQNNILTKYTSLLLGETVTEKDLELRLEEILRDIDKYVLFIKAEDYLKYLQEELKSKIYANNPKAIIIFSIGKTCNNKANKLITYIKKRVKGYNYQKQTQPENAKQYDFILKTG